MRKVKVENTVSPRGNTVVNQFRIFTNEGVYFQSYSTIIAFKPYGKEKIQLDKRAWNCSVTAGKYRNIFLNETKAEAQKKIDSGEYILTDLN